MKRFLEEALSKDQQENHRATHHSRVATYATGNTENVALRRSPVSCISPSEVNKLVSALLPLVELADLQLLICLYRVASDAMTETLGSRLKVCTSLRDNLLALAVYQLLQTSNLAIDRRTFQAQMLTSEQKLRDRFEVVRNIQVTPLTMFVSIKSLVRSDKLYKQIGESNDFVNEIKAYLRHFVSEERKKELSSSQREVVDTECARRVGKYDRKNNNRSFSSSPDSAKHEIGS